MKKYKISMGWTLNLDHHLIPASGDKNRCSNELQKLLWKPHCFIIT